MKVDTAGYVKIWRKSQEDDIFKNAKAWQLFCFCVFNARFKNNIGYLETTYPQIMDVCDMARATVTKNLKFLKNKGVIEYHTDHQKTYIKVLNYEKYQGNS